MTWQVELMQTGHRVPKGCDWLWRVLIQVAQDNAEWRLARRTRTT
jgi:hypothetical protein